jgi:hypothetical protein
VNALLEKYPDEIKLILAKYPSDRAGKRSAVMPLLHLARESLRNEGNHHANCRTMRVSDRRCGMIGFYTSIMTNLRASIVFGVYRFTVRTPGMTIPKSYVKTWGSRLVKLPLTE